MSAIRSSRRDVGARGKRRRYPGGDAIEMRRKRYGFFPDVFIYRGHRYQVHAVERCWTVSHSGWGGRVERQCFRVRCSEGTFDLYQDVEFNTWHLQQQVA